MHALTTQQYLDRTDNADRRRYSCDVIKTLWATEATCSATSKAIAAAIIRGHATVGRLITRYASFVAFNKVYSTDVNKRVHCVHAGQFKTASRHTTDDCKLGGWGAALSVLLVR